MARLHRRLDRIEGSLSGSWTSRPSVTAIARLGIDNCPWHLPEWQAFADHLRGFAAGWEGDDELAPLSDRAGEILVAADWNPAVLERYLE